MFANRNPIARAPSAQAMLTSAAALAAGLALGAPPAFGQAFQGTPTVQSGSVTIDRSVAGLDTVTVGSQQSVINWTPSDTATGAGSINFLPGGTQVTYQNNSAVTDYVVLNRILPADPTRPVQFNGRVYSQLTDALGTTAQGGAVWFYSPGGIIAGAGAVFDVGSLVLTASDPVVDGAGNFITGGSFSLQQAAAGSYVDIQPGAAINATREGSYVAVVAPSISQSGTVTVNGSAAYVAAEAAQITILNGLFDINVTVGSTGDGTPLEHYGTTTGPASTGSGDNHRIYLVAIPKNDAITMIVGDGAGQLGFDIAGAADVVNNVVVLSAGRNVSDTSFVGTAAAFDASVHMNGVNFTSAVTGRATTDIFAAATVGTSQFASDVRIQGGARAHIGSRISGDTMTIGGNATVITDAIGDSSAPLDMTGGEALIYTETGATLNILGSATITSNATGGGNPTGTGTTGSGTGGSAILSANGGAISVGGDLTLSADGSAGSLDSAGVDGGNGTGGSVFLTSDQNGSVDITGSVTMSAAGFGGANRGGGDGISGTGTGGLANISATTGTIDIQGDVSSSVLGSGGFVLEGTTGGFGQGGQTNVGAGSGVLTIGGDVSVSADGSGGGASSFGNGGSGTGGTARVNIYQPGGSVTIAGVISVVADGSGAASFSGSGGMGLGGTAEIIAIGGTMTLLSDIFVDADGNGGSGVVAGNGTAGRSTILAREGAIIGGATGTEVIDVEAEGNGGEGFGGGAGGIGTGGIAEIVAANGTSASSITLNIVSLEASGTGGSGGTGQSAGATGGAGGAGIGGLVRVLGSAGNGTLNTTQVLALSTGLGGDGGTGGSASTTAGGAGGAGGVGTGGNIQVGTQSGTATPVTTGSANLGSVIASADSQGGTGGAGGDGLTTGDGGRGGDALVDPGTGVVLLVRGSQVTAADVTLAANSVGGDGGNGTTVGTGGDAEGGNVAVIVTERFQGTQPGTLTAGNITGISLAAAGAGSTTGQARFGSANVDVRLSTATVDTLSMIVQGDVAGPSAALPSTLTATNGTLTVNTDLSLTTPGDLAIVTDNGVIQADTISLFAGGAVVDRADPAGSAPAAPGQVRANLLSLTAGTDIDTAAGFASTGSLSFFSTGAVRVGDLASDNSVFVTASGNITVGNVDSGDVVELLSDGGALSAGDITALSDVELSAATGSVIAGNIVSGDSVTAVSGTSVSITSISAGIVNPSTDPLARYRVGIDAGTTMIVGTIDAASDIGLLSRAGTMTVGQVTTPGSLLMLGSNGVTLAGASTGTGANQAVYIADISMESLLGPDFDPTPLFATAPVRMAGPISITGAISTGSFGAASSGAFSAQGVSVTGQLYVDTGQTLAFAQPVIVPGDVTLSADGGISTSDIQSGGDVTLVSAGGGIAVGDVLADGYVDFDAVALVSGGDITAFEIGATTDGAISLGNLASSITAADLPETPFGIGLIAGGAVTTGTIASQNSVGLAALGGVLTTGTITAANGDVLALADSDVSVGGVTTAPAGTLYIADASMYSLLVAPGFDPAPVFAATPVRAGGAISFSAPVSAGRVVAAGQSFTTQGALTAQAAINVDAAGLATFNGFVSAPTIRVASGDIAIGANGGLGSSATTNLTLTTTAASAVIGGTGAVSGYMLDGAEAQRVRAANILFGSSGNVELRGLTLNGAQAGSSANITNPTGAFTLQSGGSIRVTGAVRFDNMNSANALRLSATDRVEVVTDTGSIGIYGSGTTLGGGLEIVGDNIHVASSSLISQLASDPRFSGRDQALARAGGQSRTEGFIQAGRIQLAGRDTILIQNSNSTGAFGGFTAGQGGLQVTSFAPSTAPTDLVIYGRLSDSSGGFVINQDVRDAISISSSSQGGFSATSSVNGCLLSATVCDASAPVPEQDDTVVSIATDVQAIANQSADPQPVLEEDEQEAAQKATSRSPIARPVALIDTRPMNADPTIEEPVTSGGNPSLIGNVEPGSTNNGGGQ